jgi:hypothetical protein
LLVVVFGVDNVVDVCAYVLLLFVRVSFVALCLPPLQQPASQWSWLFPVAVSVFTQALSKTELPQLFSGCCMTGSTDAVSPARVLSASSCCVQHMQQLVALTSIQARGGDPLVFAW